jgi:hypothetical protein
MARYFAAVICVEDDTVMEDDIRKELNACVHTGQQIPGYVDSIYVTGVYDAYSVLLKERHEWESSDETT